MGLPVRFIVPDGYRGVLTVKLDPAAGAPVPVTNGEFVVTLSATGTTSVSSFKFLSGKHVNAAWYASGAALPEGRDPAAITLRLATYNADTKTVVYVVGTQKEAEDAFSKY